MTQFIILELDDGLCAFELPPNRTAEEVAAENRGMLVDEGPFASLEEANDAIDELSAQDEDASA